LAIFAGKPKNINNDSEIMVPPPASVLINPTKMPDTTRAVITIHDINIIA
jgi:hypothetical protein